MVVADLLQICEGNFEFLRAQELARFANRWEVNMDVIWTSIGAKRLWVEQHRSNWERAPPMIKLELEEMAEEKAGGAFSRRKSAGVGQKNSTTTSARASGGTNHHKLFALIPNPTQLVRSKYRMNPSFYLYMTDCSHPYNGFDLLGAIYGWVCDDASDPTLAESLPELPRNREYLEECQVSLQHKMSLIADKVGARRFLHVHIISLNAVLGVCWADLSNWRNSANNHCSCHEHPRSSPCPACASCHPCTKLPCSHSHSPHHVELPLHPLHLVVVRLGHVNTSELPSF